MNLLEVLHKQNVIASDNHFDDMAPARAGSPSRDGIVKPTIMLGPFACLGCHPCMLGIHPTNGFTSNMREWCVLGMPRLTRVGSMVIVKKLGSY